MRSPPDEAHRPDMKPIRLRLLIAYDGTRYQGWQTQKVGQGVQALVEGALRQLFPGTGPLHGSSRTDTGVHALGLVAHVDVPADEYRIPPEKMVLALNAHLPEDVRVRRATRATAGFHARFLAAGKEYRYRIWNGPAMNPLLRAFAWHVPRPLDLAAMRKAAAAFVGKHDFASFTTNPGYARTSTVRTVFRCRVSARAEEVTVTIRGDGFLYRMCRCLAGTLVQVGLGRIAPGDIPSILARRDRRIAGMTAPPHGLVLQRVFYLPRGAKAPEAAGTSPVSGERPLAEAPAEE